MRRLRYVKRAEFDGKNPRATRLDWEAVAEVGSLVLEMAEKPSAWGTGKGAEPPAVNRAAADSRRPPDASLCTGSDVLPTAAGDSASVRSRTYWASPPARCGWASPTTAR